MWMQEICFIRFLVSINELNKSFFFATHARPLVETKATPPLPAFLYSTQFPISVPVSRRAFHIYDGEMRRDVT